MVAGFTKTDTLTKERKEENMTVKMGVFLLCFPPINVCVAWAVAVSPVVIYVTDASE